MQRFYAIYDTKAERIVTTWGTTTVPALYVTYGMARGILKKRKLPHHQIREVELTIR